MSIEVLEPAPSTALTTLTAVKQWMGIETTDLDDTLIAMIQAASDFACRYCGREFALQKVREGIPGKGVPDMLLSLTPIIGIDSIDYNGSEMDPMIWEITDAEAGIIQSSHGFHGSYFGVPNTIDSFPSTYAQEAYFAIYEGGYVLPGWDEEIYGPRTLPYDLERAIIDTVCFQARTMPTSIGGGGGGGGGIVWDGVMQSYKIGDTSVTWSGGGGGSWTSGGGGGNIGNVAAYFPPTALTVLNYYRRAF
jgi:Phage gp6-like head-tail connector protein